MESLALRGHEFSAEDSKRKVLETDVAWVLQKRVVCVVDCVVESSDFALGIHRVKAVRATAVTLEVPIRSGSALVVPIRSVLRDSVH